MSRQLRSSCCRAGVSFFQKGALPSPASEVRGTRRAPQPEEERTVSPHAAEDMYVPSLEINTRVVGKMDVFGSPARLRSQVRAVPPERGDANKRKHETSASEVWVDVLLLHSGCDRGRGNCETC